MEKITLSLHDVSLKEQIKEYAKERGTTVSSLVENYLKNLIKSEKKIDSIKYELPEQLDILLEGIDVDYENKSKSYKTLRDEMYAKRKK